MRSTTNLSATLCQWYIGFSGKWKYASEKPSMIHIRDQKKRKERVGREIQASRLCTGIIHVLQHAWNHILFPMTEKWATIQTNRGEKILGTLSVDFWSLSNIFRQKPADGVRKGRMMNEKSWWEVTSLMSPDECLKSPTTRGRMCLWVYMFFCFLGGFNVCAYANCCFVKSRVSLRCCLMEERTSGTLCSYHPIKHINIHVIWCPIVGQHNTTNFCFASTPLASLISSGVK